MSKTSEGTVRRLCERENWLQGLLSCNHLDKLQAIRFKHVQGVTMVVDRVNARITVGFVGPREFPLEELLVNVGDRRELDIVARSMISVLACHGWNSLEMRTPALATNKGNKEQ